MRIAARRAAWLLIAAAALWAVLIGSSQLFKGGRHTVNTETHAATQTPPRAALSITSDFPAWSSDGRTIAFVRGPHEQLRGQDLRNQIYLMRPDGSHLRRLTHRRLLYESPTWSPDGRQIAFDASTPTTFAEIYAVGVSGGKIRQLTRLTGEYNDPAWSPDGKHIAFDQYGHIDSAWCCTSQIYVSGADGRTPTQITTDSFQGIDPAWSPNGRQIAFVDKASNEVYVMSSGGGVPHTVAENVFTVRISWSPDSKRIAFTGGTYGREDIYVVRSDGSNAHAITDVPARDFAPSWSPDGRHIAFVRSKDRRGDDDQIYVMDADGRHPHAITHA